MFQTDCLEHIDVSERKIVIELGKVRPRVSPKSVHKVKVLRNEASGYICLYQMELINCPGENDTQCTMMSLQSR